MKPKTAATIAGWGTQNQWNQAEPSDSLVTIETKTSKCENKAVPAVEATWADPKDKKNKQAVYICIDVPTNVGGPCVGDNGGDNYLKAPYLSD